ncbi:uncharacterized protein BJX67DRAFT_60821 [Aspergillus lucknowensis]|uniref:Uncharacterized protein n=1 Tax=Aspergillus lucknowensis TaxID=176173 RepID=A0ABR4LU72_9EURO
MAFSQQPPPTQPRRPLAIRPEYITTAEPETVIIVRNRPEPWHPLDYIISHQNGNILFTVHGHPWGLAQRRVFRDTTGLPLFELRSRWYDSSMLELKLPGPVATSETILSAKCRVAVRSPRAVLRFGNACMPMVPRPSQRQRRGRSFSHSGAPSFSYPNETVMEVFALDVDNLAQVAMVDNQRVAVFDRVTDHGVLAQGQKPPFRFRPMWRVRVARGVDLALVRTYPPHIPAPAAYRSSRILFLIVMFEIAVAVVIIGQQVAEVGLADR